MIMEQQFGLSLQSQRKTKAKSEMSKWTFMAAEQLTVNDC